MIASIVLLFVVRFYGHKSTEGRVWSLITIGVLLWTVAELIWGLDVLLWEMGYSGMPALLIDNTDYPFLAGYVFIAFGFIYKARNTELKSNLGYTFIVGLLAGTFAIISMYVVALPVLSSSGFTSSEKFFQIAFVALDVLLFGIGLSIALYWGTSISKGWYLLSAALFSMMIADIGYSALALQNIYFDGSLIELSWVAAYLLIGLAANYQKKLHESFI